jgi:hypothetical protein
MVGGPGAAEAFAFEAKKRDLVEWVEVRCENVAKRALANDDDAALISSATRLGTQRDAI